jgi:Ca-activated chloride channel family protein
MTMRFVFLVLLLLSFSSTAQLRFEVLDYDFGILESYDDRFVDVKVSNTGVKKEYILSVKKPSDVVYIAPSDRIGPDSSMYLRFQVNPSVKGRFTYDIDVFTSDKASATRIRLSGTMNEVPSDNLSSFTACPDFSARPAGKDQKFDLTVITIDAKSRQPLSSSTVSFIQNGSPVWMKNTDKQGKIVENASIGFSYFYAVHDGYFPEELGAYINFNRHEIIIPMRKGPVAIIPEPELVATVRDTSIEIILDEQLNQEVSTSSTDVPIELSTLDEDDFSTTHFKPVNVVFILDISSSMRQSEKMELMKYSLFQLIDMLRAEDRMGIVTYATDTRVLLSSTSGADKEPIKAQVSALKASGMTAGGEGIKLGYKEAMKSYLTDGVNQIIVITDGAFNRSSDDYKKYIRKYRRKGINMSVVGIKNSENDADEMLESALLGGGNYVPIFKLVDAQNNLKQEIRVLSFRR